MATPASAITLAMLEDAFEAYSKRNGRDASNALLIGLGIDRVSACTFEHAPHLFRLLTLKKPAGALKVIVAFALFCVQFTPAAGGEILKRLGVEALIDLPPEKRAFALDLFKEETRKRLKEEKGA
ncbi:MAG: hypothetical protein ACLQME_05080 [Alphaproteobacteria bacterium]